MSLTLEKPGQNYTFHFFFKLQKVLGGAPSDFCLTAMLKLQRGSERHTRHWWNWIWSAYFWRWEVLNVGQHLSEAEKKSITFSVSEDTFETEQVGADVNGEQRTWAPVSQRTAQGGFSTKKVTENADTATVGGHLSTPGSVGGGTQLSASCHISCPRFLENTHPTELHHVRVLLCCLLLYVEIFTKTGVVKPVRQRP